VFSEMDKKLVDGSEEHLAILDLSLRISGILLGAKWSFLAPWAIMTCIEALALKDHTRQNVRVGRDLCVGSDPNRQAGLPGLACLCMAW
jgi:hypothetical protein